MIKKFRKKPIVIEAEQWFKVTYDREATKILTAIYHLDVGYFRHPSLNGYALCSRCKKTFHEHGWVDTLEGGHRVCPGDFIITGVHGEKYPCKPDIFAKTYDEVIDDSND